MRCCVRLRKCSHFIAQQLIIFFFKKETTQPFPTINLFCWSLKGLIGPTAVYMLSELWKTGPSENYLATQNTSANWHSNRAERAAVCCADWWTNMKVACLFPLCDCSIKHMPVWLAGINMHGDGLSPLLCASMKWHSLSVFLCLSRCYLSIHQWTLLDWPAAPRFHQWREREETCCQISLHCLQSN